MSSAVEHRTSWQGRTIWWEVRGSGPPLVLCHGTPWSSWTWHLIMDQLAARHTVVRWDLPGYGGSSKDARHPVDLASQGRAFAAMLEHWRSVGILPVGDPPRVVAHDIGGAVALRAHLLHGCDFVDLTLLDAVVLRPWGSDLYRLLQQHPQVFSRLPAAMHRALLREYVAGASLTADEHTLDRLIEPWLGESGQAAFYRQVAQVRPEDTDPLAPLLARLRCRGQVVWGAQDEWLPPTAARRLTAALPDTSVTVLDRAGHLVQLDRPEALVALLLR